MRFRKKGKLSPRYIGPFEVIEHIGNIAYGVTMPSDLEGIHPIFHVSILSIYLTQLM